MNAYRFIKFRTPGQVLAQVLELIALVAFMIVSFSMT